MHSSWLAVRNRDESIVGDAFDETISQGIQRRAKGSNFARAQHPLLNGGVNGSIVDQRATNLFDEPRTVEMTGPQFSDLTNAANDGILMTGVTGLGIKYRPQPIRNLLHFAKLLPIQIILRLGGESICLVIECSRCLIWRRLV